MLPFRQIHLDFHTSEHLVGIGSKFDPDEFAETLAAAHVNSITCFARCHHGWIYYDSKLHPDRVHPHLERNLLAEQIAACHARGIRVPIYTTIQWDYLTAKQHPEWVAVDPIGAVVTQETFEPGFYRWLTLNSPYIDFLKAHVQEIFEMLPVDGFFFDIVHPLNDSSKWTIEAMQAVGLDPTDSDARWQYGLEVVDTFRRDMTAFVRQFNTDCTIFYNQGHIGPQHRATAGAFSHWELESLPSGGWGYMHLPVTVRYARTLGMDYLSHTGKFHTSWGDFHSFKNLAALQFECFRMLAHGSKCMIGDQLPPDGKIDPHVYDLIGTVYADVEAKEPWCEGAIPLVDIGVFTGEEFEARTGDRMLPSVMGVTRMLEELGHQFSILDSHSDLSGYKVLILPDIIPVNNDVFKARLDAYLAAGGALLASFESGLNDAQNAFVLDALGVELVSEGPRDAEGNLVRGRHYERADFAQYLLPDGNIGRDLPDTEHVMYMRGLHIAASDGTTVLATIIPSAFDRRFDRFCSHRQTPSSGQPGQPGIVQKGHAIYFSSPIFTQYNQNAPRWCKILVRNALDRLLPEPLVRHDGPSTLSVTLNRQGSRWILHLLHYIPERRGVDFDIIEDVIPLYNITVSLNAPDNMRRVKLVPENDVLDHEWDKGRLVFTVPVVTGHQMVEIGEMGHSHDHIR